MHILKTLLTISAVLLITGCAAPRYEQQTFNNDIVLSDKEFILVKDDKTRKGFLKAMEKWLKTNEYSYELGKQGDSFDKDKISLEYVGQWSWDMGLFMSLAEIKTFQDGRRVNEVTFRAFNNANLNKFGDAEKRIGYMMDVLFGKKTAEEATKAINASPNRRSPHI